jgi:hypothetical protein
VRYQENCKTADLELFKKGGTHFYNFYFLYRLKKIWCEFQVRTAQTVALKQLFLLCFFFLKAHAKKCIAHGTVMKEN